MFNFLKRNRSKDGISPPEQQGLQKTRGRLLLGLEHIFLGKRQVDQSVLDDIEMLLITADVGVETTQQMIETLTDALSRKALKDPEALMEALTSHMKALLDPFAKTIPMPEHSETPYTIMVVGVNGAGKTTTLGKLAHYYGANNRSTLLAAGDTFRAAAIDQLIAWGERNTIPVIAQKPGSDSASVIYDAMQAAKARNIDIVLADTAGRLHTQIHLMNELKKIKQVMRKFDKNAPQQTLLVLDASMGQNALQQAKQFQQAVDVDGVILTKLDGTAKGGIVFAITQTLQLPIYFIGVGEQISDLQPFNAHDFVDALFYDRKDH